MALQKDRATQESSPCDEDSLVMDFGPGSLVVRAQGGHIVELRFTRGGARRTTPKSRILKEAYVQLSQYLAGRRKHFSLPFAFPADSTPFQLRVWSELLRIPYGRTVTYGCLAQRLGTSPRAVGGALKRNPLPVLVPCHRVVAKNGLGGFAGKKHLAFKRFLLQLESSNEAGIK